MKYPVEKIIKYLWFGFIGGLSFLFLLILLVRINLFGLFGELPALEILENPKNDESSLLYSADGAVLESYYREKRTAIEYEQLPPHLIQTLIATEDERFEEHSGIDFKGTFAIFFYLMQGKKRGSSTLSQQTAKNLFNLRDSEKYQGLLSNNMLVTKIKEWTVAMQIERSYTKKEIITMYFNTVEFGRNTFGIKSAAETYFNTTPEKLTLNQCALLVGLLKGPGYYDPIRHPERSISRRNTVLDQMLKADVINKEKKEKLVKQDLDLKYTPVGDHSGMAPYLKSFLKPFLQKWAWEHNLDLYADGLKIYTSVDSRMQIAAEKAVSKHMKSLQDQFGKQWKNKAPWENEQFITRLAKKSDRYKSLKQSGLSDKEIMKEMKKPQKMYVFGYGGDKQVKMSPIDSIKYYLKFLHTGLLSVDPHSGQIKAYVGDINFRYFKFDNVSQGKRQPGSTFKPFVYAYAIEEKGLTPCSEVLDVEVAYPWAGGVWTPRNSNGNFTNAPVNLKYGLAHSVNSVAANLMMQAGPENIVSFAHQLGIESPLEATPSLALGVNDVSLFEMVAAYSAFVNGGTYIKPHALLRIEDKYGNVLEEFRPETREVMSEKSAYYMVELLKAGPEMGTSKALKTKFGINAEIGGKTGTTQASADGWFMGISPQLVTGVWVGGQSRDIKLNGGSGATLALPIWGYYMKSVFDNTSLGVEKFGYKWKETYTPVNCDSDGTPQPEEEKSMFEGIF
jgi:penicillin-binding protein 1A